MDQEPSSSSAVPSDQPNTKKYDHVSGEVFEEPLHKTPEKQQVLDFDNDDDIADPTYYDDRNSDDSNSSESTEADKETGDKEDSVKGRKRKKNPKAWKRNISRAKRHSGMEYKTAKKTIKTKAVKSPCTDVCKLKCKDRVSEDKRNIIHLEFWNERKSLEIRRQFIASQVEQVPINRLRERTGERHGQRKQMNKYHFEVDGIRQRVCKKFFLNTLNISHQTVDTAIQKKGRRNSNAR